MKSAQKGLAKIKSVLAAGEHQVIILDEANVAVNLKLLSEEDLLQIIALKPNEAEMVITGRDATAKIIEAADLVTEMKEIKHYFKMLNYLI